MMKAHEFLSLDVIPNSVRKPAALLASTVTLAAGVAAAETPTVADAHVVPGTSVPGKVAGHEHGDGSGPEIALGALAGIAIVSGIGMTLIERMRRR